MSLEHFVLLEKFTQLLIWSKLTALCSKKITCHSGIGTNKCPWEPPKEKSKCEQGPDAVEDPSIKARSCKTAEWKRRESPDIKPSNTKITLIF